MKKGNQESFSSKFTFGLQSVFLAFDRIPSFLLIFILIGLCFVSFVPSANEEQYLALSKQFIDPAWIAISLNLSEFSGTRLLYQIITGALLKIFTFEQTVLIGRVVLAALYAFSIQTLLKKLSFSNAMILLFLPTLYFTQQNYFAGSWIFLGMEAKCFAYVFIFLALSAFIDRDYKWMLIHLIVATYFHILVGGFAFIYLMGSRLIFDRRSKVINLLKDGSLYVLALIPMLIYLQSALETNAVVSGKDPNWIYTYFRNAHHTVMYRNWDHFYALHFRGVIKSVFSAFLLILIYRRLDNDRVKRLAQFAILTFLASVMLIGISLFDANGQILKFYLYRINALSVFSSLIVFVYFLYAFVKKRNRVYLNAIVLIVSVYSILPIAKYNFKGMFKYNNDLPYLEMCKKIKAITQEDDVLLYLNKNNHDDGQLDLLRRTQRSRFVVFKFVPAEMKNLPEWYEKLQIRKRISKDINYLKEVKSQYDIDYILAMQSYKDLELLVEVPPYRLYKNNFISQ